MMRKPIASIAGALLLATMPIAVFGWGDTGHRITAEIAQHHLSAPAAAAVAELTGGRSLALLATWPDFIRSDSRWDCMRTWHYATIEDGQDFTEALARSADVSSQCLRLLERFELPHNVVNAIDFVTAVVAGDPAKTRDFESLLKETGAPTYRGSSRATALALLVHFIGDVHQPLHVGRGGDRGANNITTNWFGETQRLHSVWDSGMIEREALSYTEFAAFLEQEFAAETVAAGGGAIDWARESYNYRGQVYDIWRNTSRENNLPELGYDYAAAHIGLVRQRLYQGGRRLATLLNSIFE